MFLVCVQQHVCLYLFMYCVFPYLIIGCQSLCVMISRTCFLFPPIALKPCFLCLSQSICSVYPPVFTQPCILCHGVLVLILPCCLVLWFWILPTMFADCPALSLCLSSDTAWLFALLICFFVNKTSGIHLTTCDTTYDNFQIITWLFSVSLCLLKH